jgi:hypothetical protein
LGEVLAALIGYIARKTREDILRRTKAGRERARERGVKFGPQAKTQRQPTTAGPAAPVCRRACCHDCQLSLRQRQHNLKPEAETALNRPVFVLAV